MKTMNKPKEIRFGWKHILFIFIALIVFQVFASILQQNTLRDLISDTMDWYKQNSAEQISNLTTTSLELLLESDPLNAIDDTVHRKNKLIHALNSILKQPLMKRNVEEMCVILPLNNKMVAMDLGQKLYAYFNNHQMVDTTADPKYSEAVARYMKVKDEMLKSELITSFQEKENVFHVFVPLVLYGEQEGAVYLKIHPDVSSIIQQIVASFNKATLLFSSLILMGLFAIFYISSYTIIERDEAWELLYKEREAHLKEHIAQEKEHLFTKRIYHTHHKAEKVMGFINQDLEDINQSNLNEVKYRISKYANFISRVIYDMKWYNPPLQAIRNPIFRTDMNEVIKFIIDNIFLRLSHPVKSISFDLQFDNNIPPVSVNEFVVWEILEPLIQNAIDHSDKQMIFIKVSSKYHTETNNTIITIEDNGKGIRSDLLEKNEVGVKRIFMENISTKEEERNRGYGCYLAYEIAKRCGWNLDVENIEPMGCRFSLLIQH